MPKVSVIIPVYNVEKYLRQCIDSVLAQTFKDIEVVLVDDGSTDSSGIICDDYAAKDSRVMVIHKENGGLVSARKAGFEISKGEYILNLDGDDWLELDHIENLYNCAVQNDADIVSCDYIKNYEDHVEICSNNPQSDDIEEIVKQYLDGSVHAGVVFRLFKRSLYNNEAFHFPPCDFNEDLHQTTTLTLFAKSVYHVSKATYHYRINNSSLSQQKGDIKRIKKYVQFAKNMIDLYTIIDNTKYNILIKDLYNGVNERKRGMLVQSISEPAKVKDALQYMQKSYKLEEVKSIGDFLFYVASKYRFIFPYYVRYVLTRSL